MKELLMGNEAIAVGALAAGVRVVSGYPGTPSSEVLETIARRNPGYVHVEWSTNEKAGAEVAAGAAYTGARAMVTMKQMGLNVASDPVMCVNYIGVKGGLVIYVADDPGPISSQTEQDTRHFGRYARIPVFDCDSPAQAFQAVQDAFAFSEEHKTPVILRSTTRVCHACANVEVPDEFPTPESGSFVKDPRWVIFPGLSYQNKKKIVSREPEFSRLFSRNSGNTLEGSGSIGIACGGISYAYVKEAIRSLNGAQTEDQAPAEGGGAEDLFTVLKIATPYPFPCELAGSFLGGVRQVIVFEELDPFIEDELARLMGQAHSDEFPQVLGKRSGTVPAAGELSADIVREILEKLLDEDGDPDRAGLGEESEIAEGGEGQDPPVPDLPVRPPVLCAGCPHRGSFYGVKQAVSNALSGQNGSQGSFSQAVYHGDIGCYTLGNAAPLNMVDTCLCMGAGITMAQGMNHADENTLNFAFAGDSTFFASGLPGVVNAVYNQADMILCVLDNSTTAMTGHQPHPGMGITMMGEKVTPVDIEKVLEGIGVPWIRTVDPLDLPATVSTVEEAIGEKGVRAIIFRSPCIALFKSDALCRIESDRCVGCMKCIRQIGCPAMAPEKAGEPDDRETAASARQKVTIDPALCNGCGLCRFLCPTDCIQKEVRS